MTDDPGPMPEDMAPGWHGPSLEETDRRLVDTLQELFDEFGPEGVRRTVMALLGVGEPEAVQAVPRTLEQDLGALLNRYSQENRSNTPDHLLASYVLKVLDAGNQLVNRRSRWWGLPTAFSELVDKPWKESPLPAAVPVDTDDLRVATPWGEPEDDEE